MSRVVLDFISDKSGIRPFFGNLAKCGSGQISSQIWQMSVQLQCIRLIMVKTNAAELPCGVFAVLVSNTWMKNTEFIAQILSKAGKQ